MTINSQSVVVARQRGVSLLVVLILLIVTSLLGVAVMRSSAMQERMSANLRDRSLAFEAAESTLIYIQETALRQRAWHQSPPTSADCTSYSVCPKGAAPVWRAAPSSAYDSARLPAAPEYWIEHLGRGPSGLVDKDNRCKSDEGQGSLDCQTEIYRVTVRSRAAGRADVVIEANIAGGELGA